MAKEIEQEIAELLIRNHMTVTTAESCTGGLVAGRLINAAGISAAYRQGYITYANEAKHKLLGVKNKTLRKHGAVSRQTAKQMAKGAAAAAKADAGNFRNGHCGTGRRHKRKTGRTCLYRLLCTGKGDSKGMPFPAAEVRSGRQR